MAWREGHSHGVSTFPPGEQGRAAVAQGRVCRWTLSSGELCFLRPTDAYRRSLHGQHLARLRPVEHVRGATPFRRHHAQRSPVRAPERAGEAAAVKLDRLEHLAAFANTHATLVGDVAVPDGVLGVEADSVGDAVLEVG